LQVFYNNPEQINYVPKDSVVELFAKWGGIARYVLENANKHTEQYDLIAAIRKCTKTDIMTYSGAEAAPNSISHKLLHLIVKRDPPANKNHQPMPDIARYSTFHIDIASDFVADNLVGT
jgi:hypothetical protein